MLAGPHLEASTGSDRAELSHAPHVPHLNPILPLECLRPHSKAHKALFAACVWVMKPLSARSSCKGIGLTCDGCLAYSTAGKLRQLSVSQEVASSRDLLRRWHQLGKQHDTLMQQQLRRALRACSSIDSLSKALHGLKSQASCRHSARRIPQAAAGGRLLRRW